MQIMSGVNGLQNNFLFGLAVVRAVNLAISVDYRANKKCFGNLEQKLAVSRLLKNF